MDPLASVIHPSSGTVFHRVRCRRGIDRQRLRERSQCRQREELRDFPDIRVAPLSHREPQHPRRLPGIRLDEFLESGFGLPVPANCEIEPGHRRPSIDRMRIHCQRLLPGVFGSVWVVQSPIGPTDSALHIRELRSECETFSPCLDCFTRFPGHEQGAAKAVVQLGTTRIHIRDSIFKDTDRFGRRYWRALIHELPTCVYNLVQVVLFANVLRAHVPVFEHDARRRRGGTRRARCGRTLEQHLHFLQPLLGLALAAVVLNEYRHQSEGTLWPEKSSIRFYCSNSKV